MNSKLGKVVTNDMEEFFSLAMDASLQYQMRGIGGCKHFEITSYPAKFQKYLKEYIETDKGVCECFTMYLSDNHYLASVDGEK